MFYPSKKEFIKLSKKGNLIPVYKEIPADMETPVSAFLKLSQGSPYACLLESVEGQEKIARFSFIGHNPSSIIAIKADEFRILRRGKENCFKTTKIIRAQDPLSELRRFMSGY
ncbi:MAG TPA: anthranilate synthase component I, partial [Candidatus Omnitrophota bacterium]|nr:anthranilate synthase component I [Candidatus Omnitrophota bacterium]